MEKRKVECTKCTGKLTTENETKQAGSQTRLRISSPVCRVNPQARSVSEKVKGGSATQPTPYADGNGAIVSVRASPDLRSHAQRSRKMLFLQPKKAKLFAGRNGVLNVPKKAQLALTNAEIHAPVGWRFWSLATGTDNHRNQAGFSRFFFCLPPASVGGDRRQCSRP